MKNKNEYYAIEAVTKDDGTMLCWQSKKHLYFAEKGRGFSAPYPPTLFRTKKEAKEALNNVPKRGANLKQFNTVIDAVKTNIVKINLTYR